MTNTRSGPKSGGRSVITKRDNYYGEGTGHWVLENIDSSKFIKLEDGSLWEISSLDKIEAMLWLVTEEITVVESNNPLYSYKLINTDTGESAEAKLIFDKPY